MRSVTFSHAHTYIQIHVHFREAKMNIRVYACILYVVWFQFDVYKARCLPNTPHWKWPRVTVSHRVYEIQSMCFTVYIFSYRWKRVKLTKNKTNKEQKKREKNTQQNIISPLKLRFFFEFFSCCFDLIWFLYEDYIWTYVIFVVVLVWTYFLTQICIHV